MIRLIATLAALLVTAAYGIPAVLDVFKSAAHLIGSGA